ncbi:MAG TPA: UDP-N-acetylmuramoyl-L-alanyl-D-glutamate--2,6-diaminopimelate ligase, partial [Limnobacter sp.]|nr:UDP-N-acetylmuramoyl-L-alanyl-D-glutamate--2,6-diaminopimelate ligase [Limnobacter sp.]
MIRACLHSVAEVLQELQVRGFYPDCSALVTDHRLLAGPQDVFIAIAGEKFDPRNLADELLLEQRCGLVLVEYDEQRTYHSADVVPVLHLKSLIAELAAGYYKTGSNPIKVLAVTGTNGKTTVTRWLAQALCMLGNKAAVIGTLGYGPPDELKPHTGLTTPGVVAIHQLLHELHRQGFHTVCMEASSIGLDQRRLEHVKIDTAVFTNLSQDHLDYHGDMESYGQAKLLLASWPALRCAVANLDDPFGARFLQHAREQAASCTSVGHSPGRDFRILEVIHTEHGQRVRIDASGQMVNIDTAVVGEFNADNLALALATLVQQGFPAAQIAQTLGSVTPPLGRMQQVGGQPAVVVDYAHTPDALQKTLDALRPYAEKRGGRLAVVFGCGGDRDRTKRPLMGQVAAEKADRVWITSDNPRSEDPAMILQDISAGVDAPMAHKVSMEIDRVSAIEQAIQAADPRDVILLAGKGHETTQT